MDIQQYFRKKREVESTIGAPFVVVMSLETNDGGKGGHMTEVSRSNAAKLIVEGRARLATEAEAREYADESAKARTAAHEATVPKMPLAILSDQEMRALKTSLRLQKG